MPAAKADFTITISVRGGRTWSISGLELPDRRYKIKRGRSWSALISTITITRIFVLCREWLVAERKRVKLL